MAPHSSKIFEQRPPIKVKDKNKTEKKKKKEDMENSAPL